MKEALENLKYFVGKAVSIFTGPINRDFDERQKCDYFVGIVKSVDSMGIMTQHPITGCCNYYFYSQIVGIAEEQILDSANPEHATVIAEIEAKRRMATTPPPSNNLVDVNALSKLAGLH
jgi:hypothetical protein